MIFGQRQISKKKRERRSKINRERKKNTNKIFILDLFSVCFFFNFNDFIQEEEKSSSC